MKRRYFLDAMGLGGATWLAGCGYQGGGPEAVAGEYLHAWVNGNVDKQTELTHDNGNVPPQNNWEVELSVNKVSKEPVEEVADHRDTTEPSIEESAKDAADEANADNWAYVFYRLVPKEGEDDEGYMLLVKDGDWLVYTLSFS